MPTVLQADGDRQFDGAIGQSGVSAGSEPYACEPAEEASLMSAFHPKQTSIGTNFRVLSRIGVDAARLKAEADRCRMLASTLANQTTANMLNRMAAEFEQAAAEQEAQIFFSNERTNRSG